VQRKSTVPAILLLLLGATLNSTAMVEAQTTAPARAAWTVLVYLAADNDLERPMMKNLEQMLKIGNADKINVIVLAARNSEGEGKYTNAGVANLPNWTGGRLLRVQPGRLQELASWPAIDTGDANVLRSFLATATRDFPAERYALIFGDHGMAWAGAAVAESMGDGNSLAVDEIASAIKTLVPVIGRFELIGFDACVMSNLEVARMLSPYAHYLVASEEIEPSDGWDYASWLTRLAQSPTMDGAQLGRNIADTYRDFYANSTTPERARKAKALTMTVIDLEQIPAVDSTVAALAAGVDALLAGGGHSAWLRLAQARHETEEYARNAAPGGERKPGSEVFDLVHAAENIKVRAQDRASGAAADAVIAAARRAIVYNIRGELRPHANGLSIFFPPNQTDFAMRGKTSYKDTSFAASNSWYPFLKHYQAVPTGAAERNRPKPAIDLVTGGGRMQSGDGKGIISSRVHADSIDEARFVVSIVAAAQRIIIGSIPIDLDAAGELKEDWDDKWFTISDNNGDFIAPITEFEELKDLGEEEVYWAGVPARLRMAETNEWLDVTLYFQLDVNDEDDSLSGYFVYAVEYTQNGPVEIDLDAGDDLQPLYEVIDADGTSHRSVSDDPDDLIHIDDDVDELTVGRKQLPPGHYQVGFVVSDLAGRQSQQFTELQIEAAAPVHNPGTEPRPVADADADADAGPKEPE